MIRLSIGADDLAHIAAAASHAWPDEACGLLVGRRAGDAVSVSCVITADNVAEAPAHRFEVDPRTLLAAHREAREHGEEILGPWHSHPDGLAAPSATDAERAMVPGEVWLIVPVSEAGPGPARAFAFDGTAFSEIPISA